jgi:CRP/FNR family transcriptional regulator, cyclic AMP receptor protein
VPPARFKSAFPDAPGGCPNAGGGGSDLRIAPRERRLAAFPPESPQAAPMSRGSESVARMPLFASLDAEEARLLDTRCIWRRVKAGEWVIDEQSEGRDVFLVLHGHARVVIGTSGKETILRDILDGEYFGELSAIDGKPRSAGIVAITDTVIARMSADLFLEAIHRHPEVCDKVLATFVAAIRAHNERTNEQVNLGMHERLCAELLRLSRAGADGRRIVSPPPTHAELAARISSHREAVTKALNALEREGAIARSRGAIALIDVERLRRAVGGAG